MTPTTNGTGATARKISQLAGRFGRLQSDLRAIGMSDIADMMRDPAMELVTCGLNAMAEEMNSPAAEE